MVLGLANLARFVACLSMQAKLASKGLLEGREDITILDFFFGVKEAHLCVISVTLLLLLLLC
jgi:hypothetical protein